MRAKDNRRLKEIKLSIYLNHIDKINDKNEYKKLLKILSCLALCFDGESNKILAEIVQGSICDGYLEASDKELVACFKTFFTKKEVAKRLGVSVNTINNRYDDYYNRDFITEDYLASLKPKFGSNKAIVLIDIILAFIENFKIYSLEQSNELYNHERTLEIEFWFIYNKLFEIFRNDMLISKFIFNLCNAFSIEYSTIINLKNNVHLITRQFPHYRYNDLYFMQEIYTLSHYKGLSKYTIGKKILNKSNNYIYSKGAEKYSKPIEPEDIAWQYVPTLDWENHHKLSVNYFLELLHSFIDYDV